MIFGKYIYHGSSHRKKKVKYIEARTTIFLKYIDKNFFDFSTFQTTVLPISDRSQGFSLVSLGKILQMHAPPFEDDQIIFTQRKRRQGIYDKIINRKVPIMGA